MQNYSDTELRSPRRARPTPGDRARRFAAALLLCAIPAIVSAHNVGQINVTKFLAPETVQLLKDRATAGTPGFQVGDTVSFLIQYTPLENGATVGAGGYVTEYVPAGTEVIGASIVTPNGSGGYSAIAPDLPGPIADGWGQRGKQAFAAPWNGAFDPACPGTGNNANQCMGRVAQIYADTGIFFSTDSRTALYTSPSTDGVIRQGGGANGNGYNVNPTGAGNLNTIIGQTQATTHNLWDASNTNAFGSTSGAIAALPNPKSSATAVLVTKPGQGTTPFKASSAVAGTGSGYQLDYTGAVGPWQRIAYPGSLIGSTVDGPATSQDGSSATAIKGTPTSAGWTLSPTNPLPAGTNAVRWATGSIVVGQLRFVKVDLRLTALPPAGQCLLNNSEVFGGDSAQAAGKKGQDNPWRYHVPSVAAVNTCLFVFKEVVKVNGVASDGTIIPSGAKVTYRVTYLNSSNTTQTNVVLSDTLPTQTGAGSVSALTVVSGPNILPIAPASPGAGGTFSFQTIPSLAPGAGGAVEFDVQTAAAGTGSVVVNTAKLVSTEQPQGVTSRAVSTVDSLAVLEISKVGTPSSLNPGDTVTYTITLTNTGTEAASALVVDDFLPTSGGAGSTARFNFVPGSSVFGGSITAVTPSVTAPPTVAPWSSENREQVTWNFGAQTLAAGASFTITFQATVGSAVPPSTSSTPYRNDARVSYDNNLDNDLTDTVIVTTSQTAPVFVATQAVISSFKAYADAGQTLVEWETASEVGTVGFHLLRLDEASRSYQRVNRKLLPSLIVAPQGGKYRFADPGAAVGGTYTYQLIEIEAKGTKNAYGPFVVTVGGTVADAPNALRNGGNARPGIAARTRAAARGLFANLGDAAASTARAVGLAQLSSALTPNSASGGARNFYSMESHVPSKRHAAGAAKKTDRAEQTKKQRPRNTATATLTAAGLYYLSATDIGTTLGLSTTDVNERIRELDFKLSNRGKPVAYTPAASYAGLYFYGEALDSTFSKDNAYRLRKAAGERMRTVDGGKPAPRANPGSFTDSVHAEQDRYAATALFTDPKADYWFWDFVLGGVGGMDNKPFTLRADGAASTGTATLSVQLHGATETEAALDHHAVVRVNGTVVGEDRWNGTTARTLNISFNQGLLVDGTNTVEVQGLLDGDAPYSVFYVDSLDLTYQRQYRAVGNQLLARAGGGVVTIGGFTDPKISVFDLADPRQPRFLTATTIDQADGGYRVSFNAAGEGPYLAVALSAVRAPNSFRADAAADLRDNRAGADYLVIAPAALQDAAQALVNYRQTRGLTVKLVELEAVYDQFSHGIAGPGAIRDFLAYAHANWGRKPRYAVLAGEGSFDYRNNQGYGDSVVPPLLVGTAHGLFASDSVLGDVVGNDGVPEIAVGRLPAANATELQALVNKIIAYESGAGSNRVLLLADNPDGGGNFPADSDTVAALLPGNIAADKVYLSQATLADARQQLFGALAGGVGLVNYIGHGGIDRFASEGLWLTSDVATLANTRFPVVAALTCIAGQYALPGYDSLGESLLLKSGGGAAAFWGPSGLSENEQAKLLDQQFVRAVYVDGERVLGDAILKAMRGYVQGGAPASLLNIYNLLGDPALQLR